MQRTIGGGLILCLARTLIRPGHIVLTGTISFLVSQLQANHVFAAFHILICVSPLVLDSCQFN